MSLSILEVVIGLSFVYVLISLLVSQINVAVGNMLNIRAETIRTRISLLVEDRKLQKALLSHPLVSVVDPQGTTSKLVEKVSSGAFTKAIVNTISDPFDEIYTQLANMNPKTQEQIRLALSQLKANLADPQRASAVLHKLDQVIDALPDAKEKQALERTLRQAQSTLQNLSIMMQANPNADFDVNLALLKDGISRVEDVRLRRALESVTNTVNRFEEAETALGVWYDQKMEQTRELYARKMQYLTLVVGFILVFVLNIDTIQIASTLSSNQAVRETVVAAAQNLDAIEQQIQIQTEELTVPPANENGDTSSSEDGSADFTAQSAVASSAAVDDAIAQFADSVTNITETIQTLTSLRLPIGWTFTPLNGSASDSSSFWRLLPAPNNPEWFVNLVLKLSGLLISTLAVWQGAPFWFDVVRMLTGKTSPTRTEGTQRA